MAMRRHRLIKYNHIKYFSDILGIIGDYQLLPYYKDKTMANYVGDITIRDLTMSQHKSIVLTNISNGQISQVEYYVSIIY